MKKAGIFGGTFNPPHIGHIESVKAAKRQLDLDMLFLIPTGNPPHKPLPEDSPEPGQRLEMLKLASRELSGSIVSDMEIERGSFSYTADTLKELIERYPDTHFWLIMGGDMFLSVEQWYRADYIFRHSSIAVFARARDNEKVIAHMERLNEKYGVKTEFIKTEPYEISSTELRNMLKARGGLKYLQSEVYAYIVSNRIYGVKPDFGWLLGKSLERHDAKRIPHVLGTESEAVKMAERWGCDPDEARTAAIMHDITKNLKHDEQLLLCEKYGIIVDSVERKTEKLLHAKTGAYIAYDEFGASMDVFGAIYWHTTGKANMSLLEKIMYLADYIEPTRDFDGIDKLRSLCYQDLDKALKLGLSMSIQEMESRGIVPHPISYEALRYLDDK